MSVILKPTSAIFNNGAPKVGGADPYPELVLGQEKQCGNACKSAGNTPTWYQTFTFHSKQTQLRITVWDNDTVGSEDLMGRGFLDLSKVYANPGTKFTEQVPMSYPGKFPGILTIEAQYIE